MEAHALQPTDPSVCAGASRLVTFLFTDVEGSTRLWQASPESARELLRRHAALVRRTVEGHGGHVFKSVGDGFCAAFDDAASAVRCAGALQVALSRERSEPQDTGSPASLRVRIGVHTGPAEYSEGDYFGLSLSYASRLVDAAHGGQVLVSAATVTALPGVPEPLSLVDHGPHRLRDLTRAERILEIVHPDVPGSFPPLRSLECFQHNLPVQPSSFIGREREIEQVKRLLGSGRLLTLTGAGGSGKTRLALHVAAELVDEFADGVWLAELSALADESLVPEAIAGALGLQEEPGRSRSETVMQHLRSRSALLILDNCEHLIEACASLTDALLRLCPQLLILATSREVLNVAGETTWNLPTMRLPVEDSRPGAPPLTVRQALEFEAIRLFRERAVAARPSWVLDEPKVPAVTRICRRLDGIPLAIELAAARIHSMSVEQIDRRLDDRFHLLTGGRRTSERRQQTLGALIEWSDQLLTDKERTLLRRLTVFRGGWDLESAEAVCSGDGLPRRDVLDLLGRLAQKSLVLFDPEREGEPRYGMLESIREYAAAAQDESSHLTARRRHLDHFLHLAEAAEQALLGSGQAVWLGRIAREQDNFRAAIHAGMESDPDAAGRILAGLFRYWYIRGEMREVSHSMERVLERQADLSPRTQARVLNALGNLNCSRGDFEGARIRLSESLALWRSLNDRQGEAGALSNLGRVSCQVGITDEGLGYYQAALELFRSLNDETRLAMVLINFGNVLKDQGRFTEARPILEESLALNRARGDLWCEGVCLESLGSLAHNLDDEEAACRYYRDSLQVWRSLDERNCIEELITSIAESMSRRGFAETAVTLMAAAERIRETVGIPLSASRQERSRDHLLRLRELVNPREFDRAWNYGRELPLSRALDLAFEDPKTRTRPAHA